MNPLWILLIGMAVVVLGVLVLRLHAFLALVAGALVVALLTPASYVYQSALRSNALEVTAATETRVVLKGRSKPAPGAPLAVVRAGKSVGTLRVTGPGEGNQTVAEVTSGPPPVPGDLAVDPGAEATAKRASNATIGDRVASGFGETALGIGILIAMAAIVGESLLASGAAEKIVLSSRNLLGERKTALAFLVSGYVLGIPVFFDTVFYLLIPLGKVMRLRTGRDYVLYVLAIVAGATMTHSLVPPTPGPLLVANELKVDLAAMIVGGMIVGAFAAGAGYGYALWANRKWDIPLRASAGLPPEEAMTPKDERLLPPLWLALTPILLPVLLITAGAVLDATRPAAGWTGGLATASTLLKTLGEKNVSLTLAAAIGLFMLVVYGKRIATGKPVTVAHAVGEALASAGVIILITSAGGAFGYVLRQTDIASTLRDLLPVSRLSILPLVFLLTAAVRTAQGSATVAMITAAGIASPLAAAGTLGFHPVYLALAIGCGSKPIMWMNDSGFWIIGKMSGFTETETLKTASTMMIIMAVTGLAVTMLGAWLFPLG